MTVPARPAEDWPVRAAAQGTCAPNNRGSSGESRAVGSEPLRANKALMQKGETPKMELQLSAVCFSVFLLLAAPCAASDVWLHVDIEGQGQEDAIKMSVPLSLVGTLLPTLQAQHLSGAEGALRSQDLSIDYLRRTWNTLRQQNDPLRFELESSRTAVRVFIENEYLHLHSEEGSEEEIDARIPAPLIDALLSGEGETWNPAAAFEVLREMDHQEIVTVRSRRSNVRIWTERKGPS